MHDAELRALVRDAVRRHLGETQTAGPEHPIALQGHASHARFQLAAGGDAGGACLIEPAVRCTHCGYCQSYGH